MTKRVTIVNRNHTNHNRFGGEIYASDFNTEYPCRNIANRIARDWKLDEDSKRACELRKRCERTI